MEQDLTQVVTHNQPPQIEAVYTYFIQYDGRDYIYQRRETNEEVISQLFDEEKEDWVPYNEQAILIDFLDDQFQNQTLHDLQMTQEPQEEEEVNEELAE